ncbi:translation initiation factor IF-2-like [Strigops habroptila]|uniref:translation initiation factor IF-2-like n=1 Tax=Strigops habroptila TaxID=2489341 RepID=UPI0011D01FEA|nr:translation initiation factor IF-2-like [Strigops habroptila]
MSWRRDGGGASAGTSGAPPGGYARRRRRRRPVSRGSGPRPPGGTGSPRAAPERFPRQAAAALSVPPGAGRGDRVLGAHRDPQPAGAGHGPDPPRSRPGRGPETPGEGAASGRESRHSGGAARHGTARYGTERGHYGWHRAQQTRTPSQCSEGAHPASRLPLRPARLTRRPPAPVQPEGPARRDTVPPGPGGHRGEVAGVLGRRDGPRRGSRSHGRFTHCTSIYSARGSGARRRNPLVINGC